MIIKADKLTGVELYSLNIIKDKLTTFDMEKIITSVIQTSFLMDEYNALDKEVSTFINILKVCTDLDLNVNTMEDMYNVYDKYSSSKYDVYISIENMQDFEELLNEQIEYENKYSFNKILRKVANKIESINISDLMSKFDELDKDKLKDLLVLATQKGVMMP